jgi:hypothetical protein
VQDLLFDKQEEEEEKALLRLEHQPQEEQQQPGVGQKPAQVILASHSFSCLCLFRISWLLIIVPSCHVSPTRHQFFDAFFVLVSSLTTFHW